MVKWGLAAAAVGLLVGCGSAGDDKSGRVIENRLEREWDRVKCNTNPEIPALGASQMTSIRFLEDGAVHRKETFFNSSNCTDPNVTVTYSGTYTKNQNSDGTGTVDIGYTQARVTPRNSTGVNALRSAQWCGQAEWYLNVDSDVTGNARGPNCSLPVMPMMMLDVFTLEGGVNLYLGSGSMNSASGVRPADVNRAEPYHCPCET